MRDLTEAEHRAIDEALAAWRPPPRISVDEWADQFRYLSPEASAEPGLWRNSNAPHLVEPMRRLWRYSPTERVVCKFSSQTGKTELINNLIGYTIDCDPGPVLCIQPNVTPMAERFSKQRIAPMLRDTPTLAAKLRFQHRSSANTILEKQFPGGQLFIGGANSPAGLASMPIRILLCDEVDRWEVTREGDPMTLARKRQQTYRKKRISKQLIVSSPTYDDLGISVEYSQCDYQAEWHLQCQHCGETQFPRLKHFHIDGKDAGSLRYVCGHCGAEHPLADEDRLKSSGRWVAIKNEGEASAGYWMNQWASPFARWDDTLAEWLEAGTDPARRQAVVNTVFAEPWEGEGEKIEPSLLSQRAEDWGETIPARVIAITMGADVQGDRLEVETIGWGPNNESWSLAYDVLPGEPTSDEVWDDLLDLYRQSWPRADGSTLRPVALCVDAGYATQHVYSFVKRARERGIVPIKGVAGMARDQITGDRRQRLKRIAQRMRDGRPPEILGVDSIKRTIFHYLSAAPGNAGYCHFPHGRSEEYYLQLTGERLMVINQRGKRPERRWVPIHPAVEALDCRAYAYAALLLSGLELRAPHAPRIAPEEKAIEAPASVAPLPPAAAERAPAVSRPGRGGRRNFATSWR